MARRKPVIVLSLLFSGLVLCGADSRPQPEPKAQPSRTDAKPAVSAEPTIPGPRREDVESIDAIVKSYYGATAGARGQERDWDRLRSLFVENGRMIATHHVPHTEAGAGETALFLIPVNDYIENNRKYLERAGFTEKELSRRTEEFGSIAHVWSTYESRRNADDPQPYARGLYSFQLASDGRRWYIVNVMWDNERGDHPLPAKYLQAAATTPAP
jgi:hypothetical protein